ELPLVRGHLLERRPAIFDLAIPDDLHAEADLVGQLSNVRQGGVNADRTGDRGALSQEGLGGHGDIIATGSGHALHRGDNRLRLGLLLRVAVAQLREAVVEVVTGGDAAPGAVNAQNDGLDGAIPGGLLDLLFGEGVHALHQNAVDRDDSDLVSGGLVARIIALADVATAVLR